MHQHNNQIVAQLLTLLDDKSSSKTWVIGSTNRIESIDPAIRRPGRFDHTIFIGNPDATAIEKILSLHLCAKTLCEDVCIQSMASLLIGMSGAEVASICHAAQSNAIQNAIVSELSPDELVLKKNDFDTAILKWQKSKSPT